MVEFAKSCKKGKFYVRSADNKEWLDACDNEVYVRNETNTGWLRILPGSSLVRHGSNNCWIELGCEDVVPCAEEYAEAGLSPTGTPQVKDSANPAVTKKTLPDGTVVTTRNNGDGTATVTTTPPPGSTEPETEVVVSEDVLPNKGRTGSTLEWPDPEEESEGITVVGNLLDGGTGEQLTSDKDTYVYGAGLDVVRPAGESRGTSPPGCIELEGEESCVPFNEGGCRNTGTAGTWDDPHGCGQMVINCSELEIPESTSCYRIEEHVFDVGTSSGIIQLTFDYYGRVSFEVLYGGSYAKTDGFHWSNAIARKAPMLQFDFIYDPAIGRKITVRSIRIVGCWGAPQSSYTYQLSCPTLGFPRDRDGNPLLYGTPADAAPCDATIDPEMFGSQGLTEVFHDLGEVEGKVYIDYQMWYQPDRLDVIQNGTLIATTGDYVSGLGTLTFTHRPSVNGRNAIIRVHARDPGTSWGYRIGCPGEQGGSTNPVMCPGNFDSTGAGITDVYVDMGTESGIVNVKYNAWYVEDTIDIYQGSALVATSGGQVTGIGDLSFAYDANKGPIKIRVVGDPGTSTWGLKVPCPIAEFPALTISDVGVSEGSGSDSVANFQVCIPEPYPLPVTFDYFTEDGSASGGQDSPYTLGEDTVGVHLAAGSWTNTSTNKTNRIIVDGAFQKYYNSEFAGTSFSTFPAAFQFMHNAVKWLANPDKTAVGNKRVLVLSDTDIGEPFNASGIEPTSFGTGVIKAIQAAGFTPGSIVPSNIEGRPINRPYAELEQFTCTIFISAYNTDTSLTSNQRANFLRYVAEGNGLFILVANEGGNGSANHILESYNTSLVGTVNHPDIDTNVLKTQFPHELWNNINGVLTLGQSTSNIVIGNGVVPDYTPTYGTATIAAGETCADVDVPISGDYESEGQQDFSLNIGKTINADVDDISGHKGTATIIDDDVVPVPCGQLLSAVTAGTKAVTLSPTTGLVEVEYATTKTSDAVGNNIDVYISGTLVASTEGVVNIDIANPQILRFIADPAVYNGSTVAVVTQDDSFWQARVNCPVPKQQVEAYMFDTTEEVNTLKTSYVPPSAQDIFNTWPRTDGSAFYSNVSTASGNAADWVLNSDGSILMPTNVGSPNTIVSPDPVSSYVFEAVLASSNSDNDSIGIVIAYKRVGTVNKVLALVRSQGGLVPFSGYAIVLYIDNAATVIQSGINGNTSNAWNGLKTRVRAVRNGNVIVVSSSAWNFNYTQTPIIPTSALTVDLAQDSRLSDFLNESSYGYFTQSQPDSTYIDVTFSGGNVTNKLFDKETGDVWEHDGTQWVMVGGTFQEHLGYYTEVHNPITFLNWDIVLNSTTRLTHDLDAFSLGQGTYSLSLGFTSKPVNHVVIVENIFNIAQVEAHSIQINVNGTAIISVNEVEITTVTGGASSIPVNNLTLNRNNLRLHLANSNGGQLSFDMVVLNSSGSTVLSTNDQGWVYADK